MNLHILKPSAVTDVASESRLNEWVEAQKQAGKPVYYLLPSTSWLHTARTKQMTLAYKTFDDVAELLLKSKGHRYFPISEKERALFFQELFLGKSTAVHIQARELNHQANAIAETYGQLKRLGLSVDDLPAELEKLQSDLQEYENQWIESRGLLDPENRILAAATGETPAELNLGGIVIDGFFDLSPLQYMLIAYLLKLQVPITFYLPQLPNASIAEETKTNLLAMGFVEAGDGRLPEERASHVQLMEAATLEEEIYGVLDDIVRNAGDKRFSDYGIVLPDEPSYQTEFRRIANLRKVPLSETRKISANQTVFMSFLRILFSNQNLFYSRWKKVQLIDLLGKLLFFTSHRYMQVKRDFLYKGSIEDETLLSLLPKIEEFLQNLPQQDSLISYLERALQLLTAIDLPSLWKDRFKQETDAILQKKMAFEWRVYDKVLQTLSSQLDSLRDQLLQELTIHAQLLGEWLEEATGRIQISAEKSPADGLRIFSFRDAALFQGNHLYILGMNEGQFPKLQRLGGYIRESHLDGLPIIYGSPTTMRQMQKSDALFSQLRFLADTLTFSYVIGIDPKNPKLPSKYLYEWKRRGPVLHVGTISRLTTQHNDQFVYYSQTDRLEKWAYHCGAGYQIQQLPAELENLQTKINRLATGEEIIEETWQSDLKKDHLSVTELESYAKCPFRYAMERVVKVRNPLMEQEEMDHRLSGSLLHRVIERFYTESNLIGIPFSQADPGVIEAGEARLLAIFAEEWNQMENSQPELSPLYLDWQKGLWAKKLRRWWAAEVKRFWNNPNLGNMRIFRLEEEVQFEFRLSDTTEVHLSGKIDRIDIDEHGFVIYDYKSGEDSLDFQKQVEPGIKLQLPLYVFALQQKLASGVYRIDLQPFLEESQVPLLAHGASYISLKNPAKRASNGFWRSEHLENKAKFSLYHTAHSEENMDGKTLLEKYKLPERISQLWQGSYSDFSVKPLECFASCPYLPVCRVTQEQKDAAEERLGHELQ